MKVKWEFLLLLYHWSDGRLTRKQDMRRGHSQGTEVFFLPWLSCFQSRVLRSSAQAIKSNPLDLCPIKGSWKGPTLWTTFFLIPITFLRKNWGKSSMMGVSQENSRLKTLNSCHYSFLSLRYTNICMLPSLRESIYILRKHMKSTNFLIKAYLLRKHAYLLMTLEK